MAKTLEGLHPTLMRPRVEAVLADPEAQALGLYVVSAFRSIEYQRILFERAVKKYGSERKARRWVAPPGKSNHGPKVDGYGTAVDFGTPGYKAVSGQWPEELESKVNAICARHGLRSPMEWEDWHFEPIAGFVAPNPQEAMMRVPNAVSAIRSPNGGVWVLSRDGAVYAFGGAPYLDAYNTHPEWGGNVREFVAIVANDRGGYDLLADDGALYSFGPK